MTGPLVRPPLPPAHRQRPSPAAHQPGEVDA